MNSNTSNDENFCKMKYSRKRVYKVLILKVDNFNEYITSLNDSNI